MTSKRSTPSQPSAIQINTTFADDPNDEGYELVDPSVPYFRFRPEREWTEEDIEVRRSNLGEWTDLTPSDSKADLVNDGGVRYDLEELGVSKADWNRASPELREMAKVVVAGIDTLRSAVSAAITPAGSDPLQRELQKRGRKLVRRTHALLVAAAKDHEGYINLGRRWSDGSAARELLPILTKFLAKAQKDARSKRSPPSLKELSEGINQRMRPMRGFFSGPFASTVDDLRSLKTKSARAIAIEILARAFGNVAREDLRRSAPRLRTKS
jgi:hypothetical protein